MAKKKPRNYRATDLTRINLTALKKRIALLETRVSQLRAIVLAGAKRR